MAFTNMVRNYGRVKCSEQRPIVCLHQLPTGNFATSFKDAVAERCSAPNMCRHTLVVDGVERVTPEVLAVILNLIDHDRLELANGTPLDLSGYYLWLISNASLVESPAGLTGRVISPVYGSPSFEPDFRTVGITV